MQKSSNIWKDLQPALMKPKAKTTDHHGKLSLYPQPTNS